MQLSARLVVSQGTELCGEDGQSRHGLKDPGVTAFHIEFD